MNLPVIAVNNAYEYFPDAAMLYACDRVWWTHYRERGALGGPGHESFAGIKVTLEELIAPCINRVGNGGAFGFDERPDHVRTGKNSAVQAAHVAAHAGAKRIILVGCDAKAPSQGRDHCFGEHAFRRNRMRPDYSDFIAGWNALAPELAARGIEAVNCSADSAIECFEKAGLAKVLMDMRDAFDAGL